MQTVDWDQKHDEHPLVVKNTFPPLFPTCDSLDAFAREICARLKIGDDNVIGPVYYRPRSAYGKTPLASDAILPYLTTKFIRDHYAGCRVFPPRGGDCRPGKDHQLEFWVSTINIHKKSSHLSGHHQDDNGLHGFHLLLEGKKKWMFAPPTSRTREESVVSFRPTISFEQNPGDLVFISSGYHFYQNLLILKLGWWHEVLTTSNSLSVITSILAPTCLGGVKLLASLGDAIAKGYVDDLAKLGYRDPVVDVFEPHESAKGSTMAVNTRVAGRLQRSIASTSESTNVKSKHKICSVCRRHPSKSSLTPTRFVRNDDGTFTCRRCVGKCKYSTVIKLILIKQKFPHYQSDRIHHQLVVRDGAGCTVCKQMEGDGPQMDHRPPALDHFCAGPT
jgi:hypothetical protein